MRIERIFTAEKIFTTIIEITAIGRRPPVAIWVICERGTPAAAEFAANAARAARAGVATGGGKCCPATGGTIPAVSRIEDGGWRSCFPECWVCHAELHRIGKPALVAVRFTVRWRDFRAALACILKRPHSGNSAGRPAGFAVVHEGSPEIGTNVRLRENSNSFQFA